MWQERAARDDVGRTPYGVYALVQLDAASSRESLVLSMPVGGVAYLDHVVRPPQQTPAQRCCVWRNILPLSGAAAHCLGCRNIPVGEHRPKAARHQIQFCAHVVPACTLVLRMDKSAKAAAVATAPARNSACHAKSSFARLLWLG